MVRNEAVTCFHCKRTYSRAEHLQRHLLSHSSRSEHECSRCLKSFKRKDTLRRHSNTCSGRSNEPVRGHNRACHRCAANKRKCSLEKPECKACLKADIPCRYPNQSCSDSSTSAPQGSRTALPSPAATSSDNETFHAGTERSLEVYSHTTNTRAQSNVLAHDRDSVEYSPLNGASIQIFLPSTLSFKRFSFLLKFTAQYSLKESFGTLLDPQFLPSHVYLPFQHDTTGRSGYESQMMRYLSLTTSKQATSSNASVQDDFGVSLVQTLSPSSDIFEALQPILQRQKRTLSRNCLGLFAPASIAYCLDLYWSNWHPNWPVIHKPTFVVEKCPTALLAAMVVAGSCYSDPERARDWFDVVEDLTFEELHSIRHSASLYRKVQVIQAAYLACIFQTWDGDVRARTRIRRQRFASIVVAARDLDMSTARHGNIATCLEYFDWIEFVRMEECIRTLLWVFQLDTAYIIFNNMPPHFALRELSIGLASPELSFQASSAHECFAFLRSWLAHNARTFDPTLYGLIKLFFKPELSSTILNSLAHESFMNLWCVNAAFHVVLFNLDPVLGGEQQFSGLQNAIDNWQAVWDQRRMNNDERYFDSVITTLDFNGEQINAIKPWQRPGFWKNADEYWLLAQVMLSRMVAAHNSAVAADELSGCTALHVNVGPHLCERIEDAEMRSLYSFLSVLGTKVTKSTNFRVQ